MKISLIAIILSSSIASISQVNSQNIELHQISCSSFRTEHNLEKSEGSLYSVQLEKEISPNLWVVLDKIRTDQPFYIFENLENGVYRSTLVETLINGDNKLIQSKISDPIEIVCLENRTVVTKENEFEIFPNPAKNEIYLTTSVVYTKEDKVSYEISNLIGQKFMDGEFIGNKSNLDLSKFENGSYFVTLLKDNNILGTKKLLITKN